MRDIYHRECAMFLVPMLSYGHIVARDTKDGPFSIVQGGSVHLGYHVYGTGDDEVLSGSDGNDVLYSSDSHHVLDGGSGSDTADYRHETGQIRVDLSEGDATFLAVDGLDKDILVGIENIVGGSGDDHLTGDNGRNLFHGGPGKDILDGGRGIDVASYFDRKERIRLKLEGEKDGIVYVNGQAEDVLRNIEIIVSGSGDDSLQGDDRSNRIYAGDGNDIIFGSPGTDLLYGGGGADIFSYDLSRYSGGIVADFNPREGDRIDLSELGDLSGFSGKAPRPYSAWFDTDRSGSGVCIFADINGDYRPDASLFVYGVTSIGRQDIFLSRAEMSPRYTAPHAPGAVVDYLDASRQIWPLAISIAYDADQEPNLPYSRDWHGIIRPPERIMHVTGGLRNDWIVGNGGDNRLSGTDGNDMIYGLVGDDEIAGGRGADLIEGGAGSDILSGGAGPDCFFYSDLRHDGDVIMDFNAGEGDVIDLSWALADHVRPAFSPYGARPFSIWPERQHKGSDLLLMADLDGDLSAVEFSVLLRGTESLGADNIFL